MSISLHYGQRRVYECDCDPSQLQAQLALPHPTADFDADLKTAFEQPLDFPPLSQCVVPGDKVVLAVDHHTPRAAEIVAGVCEILIACGIEPGDVTILQPASSGNGLLIDPRSRLADTIQAQVEWEIHDPADENQNAYVATTAGGQRIYLSRNLVEADFVLSIGQITFDPVMGYRGTNSVFYPGLSSADAFGRAQGQGHSELGPDEERPFRQLVDEVAWLLGTQVSVQVIAAGRGEVLTVLSGANESVLRRGISLLGDHWRLQVDERAEVVVAAVSADAGGHSWDQVGTAVANARRLVTRGGRIVILSELSAEPGDGMQLIRGSDEPRDAIQPLCDLSPPDLIPALQLADALGWAEVHLLSNVRDSIVLELHMQPLASESAVDAIVAEAASCIFLDGAQHAYGNVRS
ncbi:hypothetical protein Mal52_51060 [Symmachiella dynata]|uniref:LarA-like N-terminal domain-containing protein n=1 Tax=Symmachiella dynata TaxID=2527995 RepID=A0A517ZVV0_9PLAN|nr:lactate racemase domain-containing protein [Symmachiella dynata]QDU46585.1 hypothetical protein Mal52_51060 [Symmachiella dynata]